MRDSETGGATLDPADWDSFRKVAHDLVDAMIDRLRDAREGPVWRPMPEDVRTALAEPAPIEPTPLAVLRREIEQRILPYSVGNTHPRFWGWVHGTGTPGGMLAEMIAAAINANCGGRDHVGVYLERVVVGWARDWFGWPANAGGLLVSGSSMANLLGLAVARHQHGGGEALRQRGLGGQALVAYTSTQAHSSVAKAAEVLGLGREALRAIGVDERHCLDVEELHRRIAEDRAQGKRPFAVVATAGSVNTGAFDDLDGLADLCAREKLWLHVDGAFGALVRLSPELAPLARGIERADSLAFDFHKWLHVPYDAGCILLRDEALLRATFDGRPDYLANVGALSGGEPWPSDLGIELSRGFRALKVWWTIKEHGARKLGDAIAGNCAQARRVANILRRNPRVEIAAPVFLNIVCFRWVDPQRDGAAQDAMNAEIAVALQMSGTAVTSTTRLNGRLCLRVCITNHRSRDADFDLFADSFDEIGARLEAAPAT
jgi:aromatic-L-amino-acid/L-tryptophan decarboxylase